MSGVNIKIGMRMRTSQTPVERHGAEPWAELVEGALRKAAVHVVTRNPYSCIRVCYSTVCV